MSCNKSGNDWLLNENQKQGHKSYLAIEVYKVHILKFLAHMMIVFMLKVLREKVIQQVLHKININDHHQCISGKGQIDMYALLSFHTQAE